MQDKHTPEKQEKEEEKSSAVKPVEQQEPIKEKTEVKNANAAGQGAIGRTGEKSGPDMNENLPY